jgi:GT2 family glycosyltransferase
VKNISLVILTHNRIEELLRSVELALALPEAPEVIVVDNASSDGTPVRLKERFPKVRLLRVPFNIGAAARNLGVHRVQTSYVAFSDDDTAWAAGSLKTACDLLDFFPRVASITARVLVGREGREDPVSALMSASPLPSKGLPGRALLGFLAGASVFRRNAFLEAGGYEPRFFLGGEETLLAYDLAVAGWRMLYSDRLTVYHYPSASRDSAGRRRLLARNALWVAWLRRPLAVALRKTTAFAKEARAPEEVREALAGASWVLHNRKVLPPHINELCELIEAQALTRQRFGGVPRPA